MTGLAERTLADKLGEMEDTSKDRILVLATWDSDVNVWVASSEDVPGLAVEADSIPELTKILDEIIPDLLHLNKALRQTPHDPGHGAGHDPGHGAGLPYRIIAQLDHVIPNTA